MTTSLGHANQQNSITTLEQLSDNIQLMILNYVSMFDWYNIFYNMNSRYKSLVYDITPKTLNIRALDVDIRVFERQLKQVFKDVICWEESTYYLIPQRSSHALRWKFVLAKNPEQLKRTSQNYQQILPIISKYPVRLNTLFLIFDVSAMKKLCYDARAFPQWIEENYKEQHNVIFDSDSRWYTAEVCDAFSEINKLEKEKQQQIIVEQANKIWNELRESKPSFIPYLPVFI